jgi:hypothetical protein
LPDSFDAWL